MSKALCPICQNNLSATHHSWHFCCNTCGYEKSILEPAIDSHSAHTFIDEVGRDNGLRKLRLRNFQRLLLSIKSLKSNGGRLLDVGSAHGWFLETAKNDFDVLGLEPDKTIFDATCQRGLLVRNGYFPEALYDDEKFDVIVFNDVFEHIPDIVQVLQFCNQRLHETGLLVINLPNSNGTFYRLSRILCRLGFPCFFERMWQKDLPSPHVHYFNLLNLTALLYKHGFDVKVEGKLLTICFRGLYSRISYIRKFGFLVRIFIYSSICFFLPLLRLLPSDIIYVVSVRR